MRGRGERLVPPRRGGRGWEELEQERGTEGVGVENFLETAAAKPVRVLVLRALIRKKIFFWFIPPAGCLAPLPPTRRTLGL